MAPTQVWVLLFLSGVPESWSAAVSILGVALLPAWNMGLFLSDGRGARGFVYGICLAPVAAGLCGLLQVALSLEPLISALAPAVITMPLAGWAAAFRASHMMEKDTGLFAALGMGALFALATGFLLLSSSRLRLSWHGLLHTSIAYSVLDTGIPPENPFFAGEPLIYYWYYHLAAAGLSRAADLSPLFSFAALNVHAAFALVPCLYLAGRAAGIAPGASLLGSVMGALALNPMGPLFFVLQEPGVSFQDLAGGDAPGRLIGYMGLGFDLRLASPLTKFWNASSFAPALPLFVMGILGILKSNSSRIGSFLIIFICTLSLFLINPLVGLCFSAPAALSSLSRFSRGAYGHFLTITAALALGGGASLPYLLSITRASEGGSFVRIGLALQPLLGVVLAAGPVLVLAAMGALWKPSSRREERFVLTPAGRQMALFVLSLAVMALVLQFSEGNEYKIIRLLVYPAGLMAGIPAAALLNRRPPQKLLMSALLVLALLPNSVIAFAAYVSSGKAEVPLKDGATQIRRTDDAGGLGEAYRILREEVPENAVVAVNPKDHLHALGGFKQGDELPALTRRALYTGHAFYLTESYPDFPARLERTEALFGDKKEPLPEPVGGRPLYVLLRTDEVPAVLETKAFEKVFQGPRCALYRRIPMDSSRTGKE